jgi:hypothetical protein
MAPRFLTAARLPLLVLLALGGGVLGGCGSGHPSVQTVADDWEPAVARPEFPPGAGPVVLVDAAHGNWHTIDGRFKVFARLLEKDGYQVRSAGEPVSPQLLATADVFVIANAVKGGENSEWKLPTPPAFTADEIETLAGWVEDGGSLLLIADHMPFPGAVADLAEAFGVVVLNGYAKEAFDKTGTLTFTRASGLLADHPITRGRDDAEAVDSVKGFTGQAFRPVAPGFQPLMLMPDDWAVFLTEEASAFRPNTPKVSARGLHQGGVLRHGDGRVAMFGEAAMFTAQTLVRNGETFRFGMNDPEAAGNAQFVLNVLHWLSGRLNK